MKSQIVKNLVSNYGVNFVSMLLGFLLIPFMIMKIGTDAFGLIVLAESTINFFEILTVSVRMALSRHVSYTLAQEKFDEFIEFLSTGRYILFASSVLVLISGLFLSFNFSHIFRVPPQYALQSHLLFLFIIVAFTMSVPNIVYWAILYAKERFDLINFSLSAGMIFRALAIFAAFTFLPKKYINIVTYGIIYLIMVVMQNYLVYRWHKQVMPGIKMTMAHFRRNKVVEILSFSGHTSLSRLSNLLYDSTANVIINIFWGPSYNALYSISLKLPQIMKRLFMDSTWTLTPTFTNLVAKNDKEKMDLLFFMYTKIVALVTMPLCFVLIFFAEPIITLWVGKEFALAAKLLPLHIAPLVLIIPFSVCGCLNNAYAKVKVPSLFGFAVAVLNLALGILLGFTFDMKLYGIAIASSVSLLVFATIFTPYYSCKIAKVSLWDYWLKGLIKPLIWTSFVSAVSFFLYKVAPDRSIVYLVLGAAAMTAVYYTGGFAFILNEIERKQVYDVIRGMTSLYHKTPKTPAVDVGRAR